MTACPTCGHEWAGAVPPEPPNGTWVRSVNLKHGAAKPFVSQRRGDGWGEPGIMPFGQWEAMWNFWGPLEVCGPWGADLPV